MSIFAQVAISLLFVAATAPASQPLASPVDLHGKRIEHLAAPGQRAVVLIFAATDCPISKRYVPEIARLQKEFGGNAVAFWWVFSNPGDTVAVVRQHELDYSIRGSTIIDANQELVQQAQVSVTPEAAVFAVENGKLREAYHGRIDDLYYAFGRARPAAAQHDLEEAVKAVLAGRPVPETGRTGHHSPVGCSIVPLSLVTPARP